MPTPAHYWIVVLDIENYSSRRNPLQLSLREAMHRLVRTAVLDSHFDWDELGVKDEGDGLILFFPTRENPVRIAGDFIARLNEGLIEAGGIYSPEHQIRFRLALHHGMAIADASGWPGVATNTACRLVDADDLRTVLARASSSPLAVIASDDFYRTVIAPGDRSIDPATYAPVTVNLKKAPGTPAWIHVPGYRTPPGLPTALSPKPATPTSITLPETSFVQEQRAQDARTGLIADARERAEKDRDEQVLATIEMLEADLARLEASRARISRSVERLRQSLPALEQDQRLFTGFGAVCDLETMPIVGRRDDPTPSTA